MRKQVTDKDGAQPIGPYSQAICSEGKYLFISGQGPNDPSTGNVILGNFQEQAEITFANIHALLEAGGAGWENVVKVNVYLSDLNNFQRLNEIYRKYFPTPYPSRTTIGAALLGGIAIEVDCIAVLD